MDDLEEEMNRPLFCLCDETVREIQFTEDETVHTVGDSNSLDLNHVALENMGLLSPLAPENNWREHEYKEVDDFNWWAVDRHDYEADEAMEESEQTWEAIRLGFLPLTGADIPDEYCEPAPEIDDFYSRWDDALAEAAKSPLVTRHGFMPDMLVTEGENPTPMKSIATLELICKDAVKLAGLAGREFVASVLEWTDPLPKTLAGFGMGRLLEFEKDISEDLADLEDAIVAAHRLADLRGNEAVGAELNWTKALPKHLMDFGARRLIDGVGALEGRVKQIESSRRALPKRRRLPKKRTNNPYEARAKKIREQIGIVRDQADRVRSIGALRILDKAEETLDAKGSLNHVANLLRSAKEMIGKATQVVTDHQSFQRERQQRDFDRRRQMGPPVRRTGKTAREKAKRAAKNGGGQMDAQSRVIKAIHSERMLLMM